MSGRPLLDRRLLLAFLCILVVFGALSLRKVMRSTTPPSPPVAAEPQEVRRLRDVLLYFGAPDGRGLIAEAREIEDCLEENACLQATVRALADGPVNDLVPVLPSHVMVRGVRTEEGTAFVDFSRDLINAHPGGSLSELLTVYALANSLAANFPYIRQVRILVEGEQVQTLKGHVDLRHPVQADFSFSRDDLPGGDPGPNPALPDAGMQVEGRN